MKCQILFSGKNKKIINLSSAEFAHSAVNVKTITNWTVLFSSKSEEYLFYYIVINIE